MNKTETKNLKKENYSKVDIKICEKRNSEVHGTPLRCKLFLKAEISLFTTLAVASCHVYGNNFTSAIRQSAGHAPGQAAIYITSRLTGALVSLEIKKTSKCILFEVPSIRGTELCTHFRQDLSFCSNMYTLPRMYSSEVSK
jgi:hypothetical protein